MKKTLFLLLAVMLIVAGCAGGNNNQEPAGGDTLPPEQGNNQDIRVALVLPERIGVNPFFAMMDDGANRAAEEFGIDVQTFESTDPQSIEENLRIAVAEDFDLIIAATFQMEDALTKVAEENPDKEFAIIDTLLDLPNIRSVVFREYEASFLLGAAAGLATETNKVGMVVSLDIPLLAKFSQGFIQGLEHVNPNAEHMINYVGSFDDPAQGKELALLQYSQGVDFIAGMSAVSDLGVFEAAKEQGLYASGQDSDQTVIDPEHVVLSQIKGTDTAAYETIKAFVEGNFAPGMIDYGLAELGVGLTFVTHESSSPLHPFIGQDTVDAVTELYEQILSGDIVVTDPLQ